MSDPTYTPPKVWQWDTNNGGKFANINRPVSGATHEKALPRGKHPLQLHSLATPNGVKVTIMLEELLELGIQEAEYDAYSVNIMEGEQFSSGFVEINPNSKIPALIDTTTSPETRIFESGSILFYLAEKFDAFLPKDPAKRTEVMSWLFWQMGSAPLLGGGFGHFYAYPPRNINTLSIDTPWRSNASWMYWINNWVKISLLQVTNTPLPIWLSGLGMARWLKMKCTMRLNLSKHTPIKMLFAGQKRLQIDRQ